MAVLVPGSRSSLDSGSDSVALTISRESHTAGQAVDTIVRMLLKLVVGWINAYPNSAFSRFMLKPHGPRTDVARMDRVQRLASALVFLFWGCVFLGLWLLTAYLTFGLRLLSQDNPLIEALMFGLALVAGGGLIGGLYLLLRVLV